MRTSRKVEGWWIIPGLVLGIAFWASVIWWVLA
jgi:hypothetical protein